jgi:hypothetical protein
MNSVLSEDRVRSRCLVLFVLLSLVIGGPAFAQTPPVVQGWAGWAQCQLTIHAPGYSHRETHQWTMTGAGTRNANMETYPTSWTVSGAGSLQRVSGPTTVSAQWTVNGALQNLTIGTTLHLDRITVQRWTNHGPARGGLTGTEISTTNGVARSRYVVLDVQQWAFPGVETGTASTRANGSNTLPFDGALGPMAPGGAMGSAACTWDFARGVSSPSAPPSPAVTTPTSPTSGGAVSGGAPSGGGSAGAGGGAGSGGSTATAGGGTADLYLESRPGEFAFATIPENGAMNDIGFVFVNGGPAAVDGAVVRVPASPGLTKTAAQCSINNSTPCLPSGSAVGVAQLENGLVIPNLPVGSFGVVRFSATVTAAVGSAVSWTGTITAPAGLTDSNAGNNSYTKTVTVVALPGGTGGGGSTSAK